MSEHMEYEFLPRSAFPAGQFEDQAGADEDDYPEPESS
jgi:hypothetical protein